MPRFSDSGLRSALAMGLRGLVPLVVLGGAAIGLLVFVEPGSEEVTKAPPAPRVAAPVLLPVAEPPPEPVPSATPPERWTRDLGLKPAPLLRLPDAVTPGALCQAFAEEGWAMSGWTGSEIDPALHECFGERAFGAAGKVAARTGAFVILRGSEAGGLRSFRLRLNVLDPASADEALAAAGTALGTLFGQLRWPLPPEVEEAVAARREITVDLAGTRLRFWRERGEVARYNLGLEMPEASPPSDRFTPGERKPGAPPAGLAQLFGGSEGGAN